MATPITDDRPIRWGFLGAGGIAAKVAGDLVQTEGHVLAAVAARDPQRAADFAGRYGAERSYGDYRQLAEDPDVDAVYIATTHPQHLDQALMTIEAGKPVLIEKPVCLTARDTKTVFDAAKQADVFAMEAMWMRTNPLIRTAQKLIADGAIGEVRSVKAEMALGLPYDPTHRLYDVANGGGALLDLGVYPVTFAWMFLGKPDHVEIAGSLAPTGADATVALQWTYDDGRDAQLWCSAPIGGPYRGLILGTEGWIRTEGRFHRPAALTVFEGGVERRIEDPIPAGQRGYGPELDEVAHCLRAGRTESDLIPTSETIAIMAQLDDARAVLGVKYPGE